MDRADEGFTVTTKRALSASEKAYIVRVIATQFTGAKCEVKDGRDLAQQLIPQQQAQRDNRKGNRR